MTAEQETLEYELSLDFANTIDWRNGKKGKVADDKLTTFDALVKWCKEKGVIGKKEAAQQLGTAGGDRILRRAIELRETIYKLFSPVAHDEEPNPRNLEVLNEFLASGSERPRIVRESGRFQWHWDEGRAVAHKMLWPIAKSAADLLTSDYIGKVMECANEEEGCGWLFIDHTKNHSRIWCSTTGCGNRDKVRRYYERHREEHA